MHLQSPPHNPLITSVLGCALASSSSVTICRFCRATAKCSTENPAAHTMIRQTVHAQDTIRTCIVCVDWTGTQSKQRRDHSPVLFVHLVSHTKLQHCTNAAFCTTALSCQMSMVHALTHRFEQQSLPTHCCCLTQLCFRVEQ